MAQTIGGIAGAAIGFAIGGPAGAQWGWAIGAAVGTSFTTIKTPRIGDLAEIRAGEGGPRARTYGRFRPIGGQVVWAGKPREIRSRKRAGKGGPKVESSTLLRSYAIGICEGPITVVSRIWRNNELVYDVRPESEILAESAKWLTGKTILLGGWDQLPHPTIEAEAGASNAPAMRGTALLVVSDEDLTDLRGAIPQYQFEVGSGAGLIAGQFVLAKTGSPSFWPVNTFSSYSGPFQRSPVTTPPAFNSVDYVGGFAIFNVNETRIERAPLSGLNADVVSDVLPVAGHVARVRRFTERIAATARWTTIDGGQTLVPFTKAASGTSGHPIDIARLNNGRWILLLSPQGGPSEVMFSDSAQPTTTSDWTTLASLPASVDNAHAILTDGSRLVVLGFSGGGATPQGAAVSTDGGSTWSQHAVPGVSSAARTPRTAGGLYFDGSFIADTFSNTLPAQALRSIDGTAWSATLDHTDPVFGVGGQFNSSTAGDGQIVLTANNSVYVSADSGQSWGTFAAPSTTDLGEWHAFYAGAVFPEFGQVAPVSLAEIVNSICEQASLSADKRNAGALTGFTVPGFATSPEYTAAEALRELAKVYFFDPQDSDGKVCFIPRGGNFIATLDESEFVDGEDEPESDTTRDSLSVPRLLHLMYFDVAGGQAADKQQSERELSPRVEAPVVASSTVVMTAEQAARAITVQHRVMEEELRGELVFGISDQRLTLTEADVVVLQYRGRSQRCRITKVELMDGWQRITAVRDRQSAYTSTVQAIPAATVTRPPSTLVGNTRFAFLDLPALSQAADVLGYYVATSGEGEGWRGAVVEREAGAGQFSVLATDGDGTVMGTLTAAVPLASEFYSDETSAIVVQLARADDGLEAISRDAWLSRGNAAALVRADGTAEIVQFREAVETTPGTWRLTGLQRGRLNSGASAHAIGAVFVMLDGALLVQAGSERLATVLNHRAYSAGNDPSTGTLQARTWSGRSQREWPPIIESASRVADTVTVTWTPRHRFGSDENPVASTHFDGWQVDATSGGATRTANVLTPSASIDVTGLTNPITVTVRGRNRLAGFGDPATRIIP